jgi:WS/DGAT/MGAT family acyltransferase
MWDRLTPLDVAFLDAEDGERHTSMAIGTVAVLAGPAPTHEEFVAGLGARLGRLPRYRQRLRAVPFDLGRPVWVDDEAFDIGYHVRRTALPAPGDDAALARLLGRVMSQRLDRDRPLWECWVAEGLAGGRWAVISKVHHCMADGISGMALYDAFFDREPHPPAAPSGDAWIPGAAPSTARLTASALADLALSPLAQAGLLARAARTPVPVLRAAADTARGAANLVRGLAPAAPGSLTGPLGQPRRYAMGRASLAEVAATGRAFGATVNDVMLTAVAGGYRELLRRRGERPDAQAVRTLVPVAMRQPGESPELANRISVLLALLPVEVEDPVRRLALVHERMLAAKASRAAEAGETLADLARREPFPPLGWLMRLAWRLPQRSIVTVTTNVKGPRDKRYCLGREVREILPCVPIALRLRTGVAVMSYRDRLAYGVTADLASAGEPEVLARAIGVDLERLARAAGTARAAAGPPPRAGQAGRGAGGAGGAESATPARPRAARAAGRHRP